MRGLKTSPRVLLVEDDVSLGTALASILADEGYRVSCCHRGDEGCERAMTEAPDLVITDLRLPGMDGMDVVRHLRRNRPMMPIILMTAHGNPEAIMESAREGAFDYLSKPFEMSNLIDVVRRSLARSPQPDVVPDAHATDPPGFVGRSRVMEALYKEVGRLAPRPVTVLVRGETGTGKELVARALHAHSGRASMPFVAVNCAALTETLLESELFGHEKGAFTGAYERRIGRFEQAGGGTLFLDEIGELTPSTQAKLLRVLQEGTFERVGGRQPIASTARVVAATHVDIEASIATKTFRPDLYFRLNQATIAVPPLREHPEDIPEIARHFLGLHSARMDCQPAQLGEDAITVLTAHPWPGNVRELENVIRQVLIRANGRIVGADDVSPLLRGRHPEAEIPDAGLRQMVREALDMAERGEVSDAHSRVVQRLESTLLAEAMSRAEGNQSRVARWLGISRVTLREKLRAFGLHPGNE